ncbi:hypothetical protein Moror_16999 [Moniliophthora roreri MCA 2997]|uniref:PLC-like phosphodiesterase n=1 Tax=Moniliophthora roreri (strain MCA 2997) TaxID=1381753 RepID=V2XXR5_MONRO|nr:hypothetical protein Moror_16999 [Moniliophthora roreri MCA 2997]
MLAFSVLSLILPLLWTTFVAGWPLLWNRESPSVCNGRPELCRRRYSNITFIGAHNSYAFSEDPLALSRNQRINVSQQLDLGVRLLQAQAHVDDGELHFCHTIFLGCVWETPFSTTDSTFPCSIDRIQGPLLPMDHLYMINHSLNTNVFPIPGGAGVIVPNVFEAETTNGVKSIMDNVRGCAPFAMDKNPNFILLDWVDEGEAFLAADQLNGFTSPSQSAPATGGETNNAPARSRHGPWLAILTLGFGVLALGS